MSAVAGHDRPRRLADDRVPDAGRRAVLRRHLLPAGGRARHARLPRRCWCAVDEAWRERRDEVERAGRPARRGAAARRRARRRRPIRSRRTARAARAAPAGPCYDATGRLRRRAQVPASLALELPAALRARARRRRGARDGPHHARRHGPRRHLRPARRRVPPLRGRRASGWCRTSRRCCTTTPCSPRPTSRRRQ